MIKAFIVSALLIAIIWQAAVYFTISGQLAGFARQVLLSIALVWATSFLLKQNHDDNDWAGQL